MSIREPEEVPGTGIEMYSAAKWSRTTIADGKWLQNNTLNPLYENELILASGIHDTSASIVSKVTDVSGKLHNEIMFVSGAHELLREETETASGTLQGEIDTINAGSDVIDVVNDLQTLSAYHSWTTQNDVIKVLNDSAHEDEQTYYRWTGDDTMDPSSAANLWEFVGGVSPYYSKSEINEYSAATLQYMNDQLEAASAYVLTASGNLDQKIDNKYTDLYGRISSSSAALDQKIDNKYTDLYETVQSVSGTLDQKINNTSSSLSNAISGTSAILDQKIDDKYSDMYETVQSVSGTLDSRTMHLFTCSSNASEKTKVLTLVSGGSEDFSEYPGAIIYVNFENTNTADNPELKTPNNSAKAIYIDSIGNRPGKTEATSWKAGKYIGFIYHTNGYRMLSAGSTYIAGDKSIAISSNNGISVNLKTSNSYLAVDTDSTNGGLYVDKANLTGEIVANNSGFVTGDQVNTAIASKVSPTDYATSSKYGLVKLGSDVNQTVSPENVSSASNRTYAIQTNASGQMMVNVPWIDPPIVGNGTLQLNQQNVTLNTFSANQNTAMTVNFDGYEVVNGDCISVSANYSSTTHTKSFKPNLLYSDGLTKDSNGKLRVNSGNGIVVQATGVSVSGGNGITVNSSGVSVKGSDGITVNSNGVSVNYGSGLAINSQTHSLYVSDPLPPHSSTQSGKYLQVTSTGATKWDDLSVGTAAYKNVPASGDASNTEVVMGNDSRLAYDADVEYIAYDGGATMSYLVQLYNQHKKLILVAGGIIASGKYEYHVPLSFITYDSNNQIDGFYFEREANTIGGANNVGALEQWRCTYNDGWGYSLRNVAYATNSTNANNASEATTGSNLAAAILPDADVCYVNFVMPPTTDPSIATKFNTAVAAYNAGKKIYCLFGGQYTAGSSTFTYEKRIPLAYVSRDSGNNIVGFTFNEITDSVTTGGSPNGLMQMIYMDATNWVYNYSFPHAEQANIAGVAYNIQDALNGQQYTVAVVNTLPISSAANTIYFV